MSNLTKNKNSVDKKRNQNANEKAFSAENNPNSKEKLVGVTRCAKATKGGRRFAFSALMVVGDAKGTVGLGKGKAKEVPDAIRKATQSANRNTIVIQMKGNTIPHEVIGKASGSRVLLKPASPGTGIKAGGAVRAILECLGIQDVLTKSLGSNTPGSLVKATLDALRQLRSSEEIKRVRQLSAINN